MRFFLACSLILHLVLLCYLLRWQKFPAGEREMTIEMRELGLSAPANSGSREAIKGAVALPPVLPAAVRLPPIKKSAEPSGAGRVVVGSSYNSGGFATGNAGTAVPFPPQQRRIYAPYSASRTH